MKKQLYTYGQLLVIPDYETSTGLKKPLVFANISKNKYKPEWIYQPHMIYEKVNNEA